MSLPEINCLVRLPFFLTKLGRAKLAFLSTKGKSGLKSLQNPKSKNKNCGDGNNPKSKIQNLKLSGCNCEIVFRRTNLW